MIQKHLFLKIFHIKSYLAVRFLSGCNMIGKEVFIVSGSRTPIGSFRKSLASLSSTQLGGLSIRETINRANSKDIIIDEVLMGQVCQANAGQAPARQAAIFAGLPTSTPCTTINKVCASGMKAVMIGSQTIMCGINNCIIAGGQESMSNVPYYMQRKEPSYGGVTLLDGIVADGLTDVYNQCHMGICAENTATKLDINRDAQDKFARLSYERSQNAAKNGIFSKEIVSVVIKSKTGDIIVSEDEEYKRVDFEKFSKLRPAFKGDGTITAANSSTLNDGAASMLLMSQEALNRYGLKPIAKIISFADAAVDPIDFPIAPVEAITKMLKNCNIKAQDIAMWELNEAFAVVVLANCKLLPDMDPNKVNIHGGAVSIGHPIGMSGARIALHLALNLKPREKGIAAICNGGGGASTIMIEGC